MRFAARSTPAIFQFDRVMAKHLAARVAEGVPCNEAVVRQCYACTRQDLQPLSATDEIRSVGEIESIFVKDVVSMMECHQSFIASMPESIAGVFIAELLFDRSW